MGVQGICVYSDSLLCCLYAIAEADLHSLGCLWVVHSRPSSSTVNSILFATPTAKAQIKHVFVLMLENRSYDHILGFSGITGYDSITGEVKTANGIDTSVHTNIDPATDAACICQASKLIFLSMVSIGTLAITFAEHLPNSAGKILNYPDPMSGGYPTITNSGFIRILRERPDYGLF